jgi:hypothetical protein
MGKNDGLREILRAEAARLLRWRFKVADKRPEKLSFWMVQYFQIIFESY